MWTADHASDTDTSEETDAVDPERRSAAPHSCFIWLLLLLTFCPQKRRKHLDWR